MGNADNTRDLEAILRGAFAGSPTSLKDIPTRHGKVRKLERKEAPQRRPRRQRRKRAAA
jgi:hypothetical protein